ncbi:MAG: endolytic transglycosylase MltG [Oscillospiraceae bacterium]|nr:endolytic transglycosylase MltG [Oscillospiraceae bacterium]
MDDEMMSPQDSAALEDTDIGAESAAEPEAEAEAESLAGDDEDIDLEAELGLKDDAADIPAEKGISAAGTADAIKGKASDLAGKLKKKAGQLSDDLKKSSNKKKKAKAAKAKQNARTVEEELADLAEEEKRFDEWGRPIRKKRRRKKSRKLSCTLVLLTLILAMSSVLAVAILAVAKEMYGIDKDVQDRIVTIEEGATTLDIANQLYDEHMISMVPMFRLVSRMNNKDGSYIAGEHVLSASMSYEAMIEELCQNHKEERETQRVYFPEGCTLVDAAKRLQENQICDAEKFLFHFNGGGFKYEFENNLTDKNVLKWQRMEGYCFPDTYEFFVDEQPDIVAQKIYANFDSKITEGDYKKMDELGMTLDQVITLASMVQAEASKVTYMKKVAAVFHNRLNSSAEFPKLQSDPTSKYAKLIAENLKIQNDTMVTAYDTYQSAGLPPGAINNPGREAIEAVLYPDPDTTIFYFNANIDTGETFFSHNLAEHEANLELVQAQYAAAKAAANGQN